MDADNEITQVIKNLWYPIWIDVIQKFTEKCPAEDGPEVEIIRREMIIAGTGYYEAGIPNVWLPATDREYKKRIKQLKQKYGFPQGD